MSLINTINFLQNAKQDLPSIITEELNTVGYVLLKKYPINHINPHETILELSSSIGFPKPHNHQNSLVWDIKLGFASKSKVKTYSEHNHEAVLHTDSQYSLCPEDYFSMLCLKKASCGGGISYLLSLQDILEDLMNLPLGRTYIQILKEQKFPFVVPSVFSKKKST